MGTTSPPEPVALIAGMLAGRSDLFAVARDALERSIGPVELESDTWPFGETRYYQHELGDSILRRFLLFAQPFDPGRLAEIKLRTNETETRLAAELASTRPVNIDPGYVTLGSLVLATTKFRAHRIYLGSGIYAEVTLLFESADWHALAWTYQDYAVGTYHGFLTEVRERLKQRRRTRPPRP